MTYVYYIDGKKYTTNNFYKIPLDNISSLNENTPAFENLLNGYRFWCSKDRILHRLTGTALIYHDKSEYFYLNDKSYVNIKEWINNHPNPDLYFDAIGLNETDKILWLLQN
jgi:hypothetical protein